jgi:processive 1,2-diacylglycerol beta-glucosyltransferase
MQSRILVLSASVGGGHLRAAEAMEAALRIAAPDAHVENHDVLAFTNRLFKKVYAETYLDLVGRAPHLLGYLYNRLDQPSRSGRGRTDKLRFAAQRVNLMKFEKFLRSQPWDLVVNTHFLPAELIGHLRKKGKFTAPQVTVCTDLDTHRMWVNQPCELYFCATEQGAQYLQHWGVPAGDTEVTGIPIDPVFSRPVDRAVCQARLGIEGKRPVVLQLCGGFGVGPVEAGYRAMLSVEKPIELVVVCGRNKELLAGLERIEVPERHKVHLVGFTREMHDYMACADLVVTKPGGLTTSEILARGLPMVIANPIPGQEEHNSDFLLERGAAIKVHHPSLLPLKISQLLADRGRLAQMREAAWSLGRPDAAVNIARRSLEFVRPTSERLAG